MEAQLSQVKTSEAWIRLVSCVHVGILVVIIYYSVTSGKVLKSVLSALFLTIAYESTILSIKISINKKVLDWGCGRSPFGYLLGAPSKSPLRHHVLWGELTLWATGDWARGGHLTKRRQLKPLLCSLGLFRIGTPERVSSLEAGLRTHKHVLWVSCFAT